MLPDLSHSLRISRALTNKVEFISELKREFFLALKNVHIFSRVILSQAQ